jgi:hypothetical protein
MDISFTPVKPEDEADVVDSIPGVGTLLEYMYGGLENIALPSTIPSGSGVIQGCLALLMREYPAQVLIEQMGPKKYEQLRSLYQHSSLLNLWYSWELKNVLQAITEEHIPVMVLKGADIATTLYYHAELRHYSDVDLMVQPEKLAATIAVFERLGYHYHQEYRFETVSKQRAAFVYVKEVAAGYLVFEIHISPHSNEMGVSFDPIQMWERARPITIEGVNVRGMGLEDLLVYLCWHFRSHSFSRLIWLYDIAMVLLRCSDSIDWNVVGDLARKQGLMSTVYTCVVWCQQAFHISLPEHVHIERFAPPAFVQQLITHFVGDDLTSLLQVGAHHERKLLQRLLVDNRRALYRVLMRAVFPSPTHLGRLYMEHSRLPVRLFWLYYPLHPLFMLQEYFKNRSHRKKLTRTQKRSM